MTGRADDLGDNAALTPNDALGDVHGEPGETVQVRVEDLEVWIPLVGQISSYRNDDAVAAMRAYIPKPRLVTVNLDELAKAYDALAHGDNYEAMRNLINELEKQS